MENESQKNQLWAEVAGWYGTFAIVLAYVLVSFNIVSAKGSVYQLLNLTGAMGIVAISTVKKVRQPLLLNVFLGCNRHHCTHKNLHELITPAVQ